VAEPPTRRRRIYIHRRSPRGHKNEISGFCAAVRHRPPPALRSGSRDGIGRACITAVEAIEKKARLEISAADRAGAHVTGRRMPKLTRAQGITLVLLPHIDCWHFLYEGYFKVRVAGGWARAGTTGGAMECGGIPSSRDGPFAGWFHALGASADPDLIEQFRSALS